MLSKIQPFVDATPFGQEKPGSWEAWYSDNLSRSHILQLIGSSKDFARLVTEFSLINLYWYYRGCGNKDRPKVVVLDEAQNLSHKLDSPVGGLLTEGRKFGFSLILATQTLSNLKQDEQDRMFQAAHKLFFQPAATEFQEYATILAHSTSEKPDIWVQRLPPSRRGNVILWGRRLTRQGSSKPNALKSKSLPLSRGLQSSPADLPQKTMPRLPFNFHQTFIPERVYLSAMLSFAAAEKDGTVQEISAQTAIPMGKSSGKTPAILDYCCGMGLLTMPLKAGAAKSPRLTPFGRVVLLEDKFLKQPLTQWLAHLHLCRPDAGALAWFLTFVKARKSLGDSFTPEQLESFPPRRVRRQIPNRLGGASHSHLHRHGRISRHPPF